MVVNLAQLLTVGAQQSQPTGAGPGVRIDVSWDNVTEEYLLWLSKKSGQTYRLLTEAEWKYAARAGTAIRHPWGDDIGKGNANCAGCGSQWDDKQTAPVGSFKPNAFGLYDMNGNVWQWVQDSYVDTCKRAANDGAVAAESSRCRRVVHGGSGAFIPWYSRSAARLSYPNSYRIGDFGFRVARLISPPGSL